MTTGDVTMFPGLRPFRCRVVRPEHGAEVIAPAYDALTAADRRAWAAERPLSWLHVIASPDDVDPPADPLTMATTNRGQLQRILQSGAFGPLRAPAMYLYRLTYGDHRQTGVVGELPLTAWTSGRLRGHERVRPSRVQPLEAALEVVGVTSSPVATTWRAADRVDPGAEVERLTDAEPLLSIVTEDGVGQEVWAVDDDETQRRLSAAVGQVMYIIDGHHRAVAAARHHDARPGRSAADAALLVVAFPSDRLQVDGFHRLVLPVDGHHPVDPRSWPGVAPAEAGVPGPGRVRGWVDGAWWEAALPPTHSPGTDVERLHHDLLMPADVDGTDVQQVRYVAAGHGLDELERRTAAAGGVALVTTAPSVDDVLDVADRGGAFPPKATFFHPKPRSGIFVRLHDPELEAW